MLLLHYSSLARQRLEEFHRPASVNSPQATTQDLGALAELIEAETAAGRLHPETLLDWRPLSLVSASLTPRPRRLFDLLDTVYRADGAVPTPGLATIQTLKDALTASSALKRSLRESSLRHDLDVLTLSLKDYGPDRQLILRGRFSPEGRRTLRQISATIGLSRERVRQTSLTLASRLFEGLESNPVPYFRSARLFLRDSDRLPAHTGTSVPKPPTSEDTAHIAQALGRQGLIPPAPPEHAAYLTVTFLTYDSAIMHYQTNYL